MNKFSFRRKIQVVQSITGKDYLKFRLRLLQSLHHLFLPKRHMQQAVQVLPGLLQRRPR